MENTILPDHVLFCILRVLKIFGKKYKMFKICLEKFVFLLILKLQVIIPKVGGKQDKVNTADSAFIQPARFAPGPEGPAR